MKHLLRTVFLAVIFCGPVSADFSGDYTLGLWDIAESGGTIDLGGAPGSVSLTSNNGGGFANTDLSFTAFEAVTITFDWDFTTVDPGIPGTNGAQWDPFGYLLNGSFTKLTNDAGADSQSGTAVTFAVAFGDTFGFRANTIDGIFGAATTTITNFSAIGPAPAVVPLPPSVSLLGFALGGVLLLQRRRRSDLLPRALA
ncbi:MAG: PEP-CTERM sorting domain-containing protein [Proteobacteria bacterium]|nr:MAG: PEP-CTERM sorting domain-containing protein [Pseudomonadota bacterium]